jgi:hypothetical protein
MIFIHSVTLRKTFRPMNFNNVKFGGIEPAQSETIADFQPSSAAGTSCAGRDQGIPTRVNDLQA